MAENQGGKFNIYGSVGNLADTIQSGGKQLNIQHINTIEQKQNLAEATEEIQNLLNRLAQNNPKSKEVFIKSICQEIKCNYSLKERLINAGKAGGLEALKVIFNNPFFSIPAETIKGFLESE